MPHSKPIPVRTRVVRESRGTEYDSENALMSQRRAQTLSMVAAGAAAAFGATAVATATRASAHVDRKVAPKIAFRARTSGRRAHDVLSPVGKWHTLMPAAIVAGAVLASRRQHRAAGVGLAASG